jgi:DNA replication factor GINS
MVGFSFDDIKRAWTREKTSREPAKLSDDFYSSVAKHVAELKRELRHGERLRQELLRAELREVVRMVQEIHLLRVLKTMDQITKGRLPTSLLDRERYAFDEIKGALHKLHAELIAPVISGEAAISAKREITNEALIILTDMPQIIGDDLKQYGPFKSGEVAFLPKRSAQLLIKQKVARRIEVGPL